MYPATYEADYLRKRKRFTTFFRLIVAIPWLIVAYIYQAVLLVTVLISWIVIILLGRFPQGMYNFVGGLNRYLIRVSGFVYLQTDAWPSFGISHDPSYPIRVNYLPPAARQSRFKALIRIILVLPLVVMNILMSSLLSAVAIIAWITIVFRGYQPAAIHNALAFTLGWMTRYRAYLCIMRDEYPPVGDEVLDGDGEPAALPPAPAVDQTDEQNDPYGTPAVTDPVLPTQQPEQTQPPVPPQYQDPAQQQYQEQPPQRYEDPAQPQQYQEPAPQYEDPAQYQEPAPQYEDPAQYQEQPPVYEQPTQPPEAPQYPEQAQPAQPYPEPAQPYPEQAQPYPDPNQPPEQYQPPGQTQPPEAPQPSDPQYQPPGQAQPPQ